MSCTSPSTLFVVALGSLCVQARAVRIVMKLDGGFTSNSAMAAIAEKRSMNVKAAGVDHLISEEVHESSADLASRASRLEAHAAHEEHGAHAAAAAEERDDAAEGTMSTLEGFDDVAGAQRSAPQVATQAEARAAEAPGPAAAQPLREGGTNMAKDLETLLGAQAVLQTSAGATSSSTITSFLGGLQRLSPYQRYAVLFGAVLFLTLSICLARGLLAFLAGSGSGSGSGGEAQEAACKARDRVPCTPPKANTKPSGKSISFSTEVSPSHATQQTTAKAAKTESVSAVSSQAFVKLRSALSGASEGEAAKVEALKSLAEKLQGKYLKYPKDIGKSVFFFPKERYFAVVPQDDAVDPLDWARQVQMWRRGRLSYWADQESFERNAAAKGFIDVMRITKVTWESPSTEVKIKHWQDGATFELVLKFQEDHLASHWGKSLQEMRKVLQQTVLKV